MWTKVFFTCVNSSSFTWVIVIAYLRHVERFFPVRFWQKVEVVFESGAGFVEMAALEAAMHAKMAVAPAFAFDCTDRGEK